MKINVLPNEFRNLILLFIFGDLLNIDSLQESEYKNILKKMAKNGFKSHLLDFFMNTDSKERINVKWLMKSFEKDSGIINNINVFPSVSITEETDDIEFEKYIEKIIEETIKVVVNKEDPNPTKVLETKNEVFNRLLEEEEYE